MDNPYVQAKQILNTVPKTREELNKIQILERNITNVRVSRFIESPIQGNFDFQHITEIHYQIFKDLYDFAGKARINNFSKHIDMTFGVFFEDYQQAPKKFDEFSQDIIKNQFYQHLQRDEFIDYFTTWYAQLNYAHPFEDGNGRSLRLFMMYFAHQAGYDIQFPKSSLQWNRANYQACPNKFRLFESYPYPIDEPVDLIPLRQIFDDGLTKRVN